MDEPVDPRLAVLRERLKGVKQVYAFMSSKGGVGKTLISVLTSLTLSELGKSVGLLDLDVTNPNAHVILGANVEESLPEEEKGVLPVKVRGIKFMSVAFYTKESPVPLRGDEVASAIREILAITRWGELDYLVIDTPPGMSDPLLELLTFIKRVKPVVVTTPSLLSLKSVRRLLTLLKDVNPPHGLVENMSEAPSENVVDLAREFSVRYLGNVPYAPIVEEFMGRPEELLRSPLGNAIRVIVRNMGVK